MKIRSIQLVACITIILLFAGASNCLIIISSAEDHWKFAVLCDTRGNDTNSTDKNSNNKSCINNTIVKELAKAIVGDECDLVLVPGDLVNGWFNNSTTTYETQFNNWKWAMDPVYNAKVDIYIVRGNHENGGYFNTTTPNPDAKLKSAFIKAFGSKNPSNGPPGEENLTYSFTHKNALFIGLDDYNYITPHRVNQTWLDQQLRSNNKSHIFVFGHEPAFQVNHPDCLGTYPQERDVFWQSIAAAGGRVYFCGHDHFYNRAHVIDSSGNKFYQMVIGSCGAPLRPWNHQYKDTFVQGDYHNQTNIGYTLVTIDGDIAWIEWKALQNDSWITRDSFAIKSSDSTLVEKLLRNIEKNSIILLIIVLLIIVVIIYHAPKLRFTRDKLKFFALEIAFLNALGFAFSVLIPYWVDPKVNKDSISNSNIILLPASYIYLIIFFTSLIIFIVSRFNIKREPVCIEPTIEAKENENDAKSKAIDKNLEKLSNAALKAIRNFLIMGFFAAILFWIFRQEFPKPAVINYDLITGFITSIAIYIRCYKIDFRYIENSNLVESIKLERLKLDYDVWSKIFNALIVSFFAFYIGYLAYVLDIIRFFVGEQNKFDAKSAYYLTILYIPFLFLVVIYEVYRKMADTKEHIIEIKDLNNKCEMPSSDK